MFDRISRWYDLLNHLLSAGQDMVWRRRGVKRLLRMGRGVFLDVATGTGDVAFEIKRQSPQSLVVGLDPAEKMLEVARKKALRKGLSVLFVRGEGERLPFKDGAFDGVAIAFGIRNVEDRRATLSEFARVLKRDGVLVILEFSKPEGLAGKVYNLYFHHILPLIGWVVSGDREAYTYLPRSVEEFPAPEQFARELMEAGFSRVLMEPYTMGICYCYTAFKEV